MDFVPAEAFAPFVVVRPGTNLELCKYSIILREFEYAEKNLVGGDINLFRNFFGDKEDELLPIRTKKLRLFCRFVLESEELALSNKAKRTNNRGLVVGEKFAEAKLHGWPIETVDFLDLKFVRKLEARLAFFVTRKFRLSLAFNFLENVDLWTTEQSGAIVDLDEMREKSDLWRILRDKRKKIELSGNNLPDFRLAEQIFMIDEGKENEVTCYSKNIEDDIWQNEKMIKDTPFYHDYCDAMAVERHARKCLGNADGIGSYPVSFTRRLNSQTHLFWAPSSHVNNLYFLPDEESDSEESDFETPSESDSEEVFIDMDVEKLIYDEHGHGTKRFFAEICISDLVLHPDRLSNTNMELTSFAPYKKRSRSKTTSPNGFYPSPVLYPYSLQNYIGENQHGGNNCCSSYYFPPFADDPELLPSRKQMCSKCFLINGFFYPNYHSLTIPETLSFTGQSYAVPSEFQLQTKFISQLHRDFYCFRRLGWTDETFLFIGNAFRQPYLEALSDPEVRKLLAETGAFQTNIMPEGELASEWNFMKLAPSLRPVDFMPQTWAMEEKDTGALLAPNLISASFTRPFRKIYPSISQQTLDLWAHGAMIGQPFSDAPDFFNEFFHLGCTNNTRARNDAMRLHYFWRSLEHNSYQNPFFRKIRKRYGLFRNETFFEDLPEDLIDLICEFAEEQEFWTLPEFYEEIVFEHAKNFIMEPAGGELRKMRIGRQEFYAELSRQLPNACFESTVMRACRCDICVGCVGSRAELQLQKLKKNVADQGAPTNDLIQWMCLFMPKAWQEDMHHLSLRLPRLWHRLME
jgi:hypothetical protein